MPGHPLVYKEFFTREENVMFNWGDVHKPEQPTGRFTLFSSPEPLTALPPLSDGLAVALVALHSRM